MKLTIELVPQTSWFSNVRSEVTQTQWDVIRKSVYSKAYDICEICGGVGPKHPVECHEIWSYDDQEKLRKLEGMIALCPSCHMVKHMGFAQIQNKGEQAIKHFMRVNKLTRAQARAYIDEAFQTWEKRSQYVWTVDISHLSEYGIDITKLRKNKQ